MVKLFGLSTDLWKCRNKAHNHAILRLFKRKYLISRLCCEYCLHAMQLPSAIRRSFRRFWKFTCYFSQRLKKAIAALLIVLMVITFWGHQLKDPRVHLQQNQLDKDKTVIGSTSYKNKPLQEAMCRFVHSLREFDAIARDFPCHWWVLATRNWAYLGHGSGESHSLYETIRADVDEGNGHS